MVVMGKRRMERRMESTRRGFVARKEQAGTNNACLKGHVPTVTPTTCHCYVTE